MFRIMAPPPCFAGYFWKKNDSRSRNLFVLKHIWVKVSITWKFQPNWSNNTLKTGFFRISGKSGSRIRNFFGLKPSRDQDGANKKKFSQIGPAVLEEIGRKHTHKPTNIVLLYNRDCQVFIMSANNLQFSNCFCNFIIGGWWSHIKETTRY